MTTPTLRQIAAEAGVSIVTVSRILSGKYPGTTRKGRARVEQVEAIAARLGYRGDMAASAMRTGRTRQIGVAIHDDSAIGHTVNEVLSGIHDSLAAADHSLLLLRMGHGDSDGLLQHASVVRGAIDGLILIDGLPPSYVQNLPRGIPVLQVNDRPADGAWIAPDDAATSRDAGADLRAAGYRRAVLVTNLQGRHPCYALREAGFGAGFGDSIERTDFTLSLREADLAKLREWCEPGTVLVATDIIRSIALADGLQRIGLRPGTDVGLAALDAPWMQYLTNPTLARVTYDRIELGRRAGELLLSALDGSALAGGVLHPGTWRPGETAPGPG